MTCLLDTCTFLWLSDHTEHLSPGALSILEDSGVRLLFSQVSSLEIQIKYNAGKLPLALPPKDFIAQAIKRHGLHHLPLADEHIWTLEKLPPLHGDPFDRLLIAQAIHEGLRIITPDPHIHAYPVRAEW